MRAGDTAGAAAAATTAGLAAEKAVQLKAAMAASNVEAATFSSRMKDALEHMERFRARIPLGGLGGIGGGLISSIPLTGPLLGVGAAAAAGAALLEVMGKGIERAHQIELVSEALGASTGEVREWGVAAGKAGVDQDLFFKSMERLAASAEKAAEAQKKLRVETAQMLASDGIVARGGRSAAAETRPTSHLVDMVPGAPIPKIEHEDEVQQNIQEMREAKFRAFADSQFRQLQDAQQDFITRNQPVAPLPSRAAFDRDLRERMATDDKVRENFAKFGGDPNAANMKEQLGRMMPGFSEDIFSKNKIELMDQATGKMREFRDYAKDAMIAMSKMSDSAALLFARTTQGKGALDPALVGFEKSQGRAGGGALDTPKGDDPDVTGGARLKKALNAEWAQFSNDMLTITGTIIRGIDGLKKSFVDAKASAIDMGTALTAVGDQGIPVGTEQSFEALETTLRKVRDLARSAAAAVGAAMGGNTGGSTDDTGLAQFASGGYIRGPGSGTSDSIFARLSNGEYVMSAAAVRRLGVGNLNAMNFGRHIPRFAEGGPVGSISSGGHLGTVHLTLDGQTHSLRADRQNFEGIVQYARTRRLAQIAPRPANAT